MTRFQLMSMLQGQTVQQGNSNWDVWFQGWYLGTVVCVNGLYFCHDEHSSIFDQTMNFTAAIAKYIDTAEVVHLNTTRKALVQKDPEIKQIGLRKKSRWIDKVKGWFK